jgi:hypothetical protein
MGGVRRGSGGNRHVSGREEEAKKIVQENYVQKSQKWKL